MSHLWNNLATYWLVSCKMSIFCKNVAEGLLFSGILPDVYFFAGMSKDIHFWQKRCKIPFFGRIWQDMYYLQQSCSYNLISRIFLDIFYLEESGKISVVCKIFAGYLFLRRIVQEFFYLQEYCKIKQRLLKTSKSIIFWQDHYRQYLSSEEVGSRKISVICKNLAKDRYFEKTWRISIVCKNPARYIVFAGVLQGIFWLQESCKISIVCKNLASYLMFAWLLQDTFFWGSREKLMICKVFTGYLLIARKLQVV